MVTAAPPCPHYDGINQSKGLMGRTIAADFVRMKFIRSLQKYDGFSCPIIHCGKQLDNQRLDFLNGQPFSAGRASDGLLIASSPAIDR